MRGLDPALHAQHGCCSADDLHSAFVEAAGRAWTVETCCVFEGRGFCNCGLGELIGRRGPVMRAVGYTALAAWHQTVTRLPAPAARRPNAILVERGA